MVSQFLLVHSRRKNCPHSVALTFKIPSEFWYELNFLSSKLITIYKSNFLPPAKRFLFNLGRGGKSKIVEKCSTCRGSGVTVSVQQIGPGMIQQVQNVCNDCKGQGERINPKDKCRTCAGKKVSESRGLPIGEIGNGVWGT